MNTCPTCGKELPVVSNFCPFCGHVITPIVKKLTTWGKIKIYTGSILLTPFSLYWFFKYFRDKDNKNVAYISLIISIVSLVLGILIMNDYMKALTSYTNNMYNF